MNLQDFQKIDQEKRLKFVIGGVCIASREENGFRVLLFQVDSFYVEVFYHQQYNFINHLNAFDSLDQLDPYLEKISLKGLLLT